MPCLALLLLLSGFGYLSRLKRDATRARQAMAVLNSEETIALQELLKMMDLTDEPPEWGWEEDTETAYYPEKVTKDEKKEPEACEPPWKVGSVR